MDAESKTATSVANADGHSIDKYFSALQESEAPKHLDGKLGVAG